MEGLVLTMTIKLSDSNIGKWKYHLEGGLMFKGYGLQNICDSLWIDGVMIRPDDANRSSGTSESPLHFIKYQFKSGIDFIPENAFYETGGFEIKSIVIPEGIKTLKARCFYGRHFAGNLILPKTLERICVEALDNVQVDGDFHIPPTVKYVSSLPAREMGKNEIILPEGMVSFIFDDLDIEHLHIPSTLKTFHSRWDYGDRFKAKRITIAPDNPFFILRDGKLISLVDEKREKLKKLQRITRKAIMTTAFAATDFSFELWYKEICVHLTGKHRVTVRCPHNVTVEQAGQIVSIAQKYNNLIKESGLSDDLQFSTFDYRSQSPGCFFNYGKGVDVYYPNGTNTMEGLCKATAFFKKLTRLADDLKNHYKEKELSYYLSTR